MAYILKQKKQHNNDDGWWIADMNGDPGRTLVQEYAKEYETKVSANRAIGQYKARYGHIRKIDLEVIEVLKYFISGYDTLCFRPIVNRGLTLSMFSEKDQEIIGLQNRLELISSYYPDAPIEGNIHLNIKSGYKLSIKPVQGGFNFVFDEVE